MYQSIVNFFQRYHKHYYSHNFLLKDIVNVANTVVLFNCFIMSPLRFAPEYQEGALREFRARKEREARSSEEKKMKDLEVFLRKERAARSSEEIKMQV